MDIMMTKSKVPPIHTLRVGNLKAAIWRNEKKDGSSFLVATFSRPFKNKFNKWCNGTTFSLADLEVLPLLMQQTKDWIKEHGEQHE